MTAAYFEKFTAFGKYNLNFSFFSSTDLKAYTIAFMMRQQSAHFEENKRLRSLQSTKVLSSILDHPEYSFYTSSTAPIFSSVSRTF